MNNSWCADRSRSKHIIILNCNMGCGSSKNDKNVSDTVIGLDARRIMQALEENVQTPFSHLIQNISEDINEKLGLPPHSHSTPELEEIVDFSSKFHYVMVFPLEDGKQSLTCKHACRMLIKRGFEIFTYLSVQSDELYCLITCSETVLMRFAQLIEYKSELDPDYAREMLEAGDPEKHIAPCSIPHVPSVTSIPPYSHIYAKRDPDAPVQLYALKGINGSGIFSESTKLKLIYEKLVGPIWVEGCAFPIDKLLQHSKILAFYPMHNFEIGKMLYGDMKSWKKPFPWIQPFDDIRAYFGEKIALYFCFLGNYSYHLILPSVIGGIVQVYIWFTKSYNTSILLAFFSLFICLWSVVMLESWKREEKMISLRWGMVDFEKKELDRPEYSGDMIRSYINGGEMKFFPQERRNSRIRYSILIISIMLLLTVGTVAGIYILRFQLAHSTDLPAATIASLLNTAQIAIFNIIYSDVSLHLTKYENHRTDTEFEDALISKVFVFQFINSYSSFFFLAFIASYLPNTEGNDYRGECGSANCMEPLAFNIAIIFGSRIIITNVVESSIIYMKYVWNRKRETKGTTTPLTKPEEDYLLFPYSAIERNIDAYADLAIQFGFVTLFIPALPIACAFALLTNTVKCKVNVWKLFVLYQRPIPQGAEDVGSWQGIFEFIAKLSVVTNGALICFTADIIPFSFFGKACLFVIFQWIIITLQFCVDIMIPDTPKEVEIQLARMDFIVSKLINKEADDMYDPLKSMQTPISGAVTDEVTALLSNLNGTHAEEVLTDIPVATYPRNVPRSRWPKSVELNISTNDEGNKCNYSLKKR